MQFEIEYKKDHDGVERAFVRKIQRVYWKRNHKNTGFICEKPLSHHPDHVYVVWENGHDDWHNPKDLGVYPESMVKSDVLTEALGECACRYRQTSTKAQAKVAISKSLKKASIKLFKISYLGSNDETDRKCKKVHDCYVYCVHENKILAVHRPGYTIILNVGEHDASLMWYDKPTEDQKRLIKAHISLL